MMQVGQVEELEQSLQRVKQQLLAAQCVARIERARTVRVHGFACCSTPNP